MKKYLIALAMVMVFATFAQALSISVPKSVDIEDDFVTFYADITNNSNEILPLTINFYTTTKSQVVAPKTITPNSTIRAKITVYNNLTPNYHEVESKLEVYLGKQFKEETVTLKFFEKEKLVQLTNSQPTNNSQGTTQTIVTDQNQTILIQVTPVAWFGLGSFIEETSTFDILDWVIFWVLVMIAAILVVAFVSRVVRRI